MLMIAMNLWVVFCILPVVLLLMLEILLRLVILELFVAFLYVFDR